MFSVLPEPVSAWWALATALPASALALFKRRAPTVALVIATLLFAIDLMTVGGVVPLILLLELVYAASVAATVVGRRYILFGIATITATFGLASFLLERDLGATIMIVLQVGALLGTSYWYATSVVQSRELLELQKRLADDAALLAEQERLSAVQRERARMARELHDVVAGHVAAASIRAEAALSVPGADSVVSAERNALRAVRESTLSAHSALRSMIGVLLSGSGDFEIPLGRERVPEFVEAANHSGVTARLHDEVTMELPTPVDQTLGRIVQEALANSVRHASGAHVEVNLSECELPDGALAVHIEVVSAGGQTLLPELAGNGMGLELLRERASALGGVLTAAAEAGERWRVSATLPVVSKQQSGADDG